MEEKTTLDVQNLNIYFKTADGEQLHAVRDLTFQVKRGELLGIDLLNRNSLVGGIVNAAVLGIRVCLDGRTEGNGAQAQSHYKTENQSGDFLHVWFPPEIDLRKGRRVLRLRWPV